MRLIRWVGLGALTLIVGSGLVVAAIVFGSLPNHRGELTVSGLTAPVVVRRDSYAVPYIEAANEADGYFALGFVHAQDRLWQLELRRRLAQGRLAELIGSWGLPSDRFMRLLRFHELAAASLDHMRPEHRRLVSAYTAGINAFLTSRRRLLPPAFWLLWHRPEPWQDADSVVFVKLMALDLAGNWQRELLRARLAGELPGAVYRQLFPYEPTPDDATLEQLARTLEDVDLDALAALIGPPAPPGHGSNAWVVDGSRTPGGRPLLANDPHLGFTNPGTWYLAGLETPELEVVGATLPGLPVFVLGRTDRIAWGMTNTGSDVQDLVVEELLGAGPTATRTPGGSAPITGHQSIIRCRFCPDEPFEARWSVNGPLVSDLVASAEALSGPGRAMALRWAVLRADDVPLDAGFAIPHARDWASFNEALRPFTNPQQNVFYASVDGDIGLVAAGAVPIRRQGDGTLPVRGWERSGGWDGFIPFGELPRRVAPIEGFLANANNALVTDDYPYLLTRRWDAPWRFQRIVDRLTLGPHDIAGFQALQTDVRSGVAAALLPALLTAAPLDARAEAWRERLARWDYQATVSSQEMTVFATWLDALPEFIYADELGADFETYGRYRPQFIEYVLKRAPSWCDDVATAAVETCTLASARALETALDRLERSLGPKGVDWQWGSQHPAVFSHDLFGLLGPFGRLSELGFPVGGDDTSVAATSYVASAEPPLFPAVHGAGYRQVIDLTAPATSQFVTPTGQVGHPASRHYRDLAVLWQAGRGVPMAPPATATAALRLQTR